MSINDQVIKLIEKYQNSKPSNRPARCVHVPSCSNYSKECYQKFNFFKATFLTIKRIIFCTPLNKKAFDPVPLSKQEKQLDLIYRNKAKEITPYLIEHFNNYPLLEVQDLIKFIYQATFGPKHMHTPSKEQINLYLENEFNSITSDKETIEKISCNYVRIHLGKNSDLKKISDCFIATCNKEIAEDAISIFYKRLDLLIELIKKKKIPLKKKTAIKFINDYLFEGIKPIHHSDTYRKNYNPHYRVIEISTLNEIFK